MNRRNFFRALSALAGLPIIAKWLKAKMPDYPPEALTTIHAWDVERVVDPWSVPQMYALDGPEPMFWGGDVGSAPTYISTIRCGDIREKWYYADGWGFVKHSRERRENGIYVTEWVVLGANTRDKKWETIEA